MRKYKLLLPVALSCGFVIASCSPSSGGGGGGGDDKPTNKINLEWDNGNELSENNLSVRCEAVLDFNDNGNAVVTWSLDSILPTGINEYISDNFITFTMTLGTTNISSKNIKIEASHANAKTSTTYLNIKSYTVPLTYDYRVELNVSSINLNQSSKEGEVTAVIKDKNGNVQNDKQVTWVQSTLDVLPIWINVDITTPNVIKLSLVNGVATIASNYTIRATYIDGSNPQVIDSTFVIATENYEVWQSNWIPKNLLKIVGNTLEGFVDGTISLDGYDTLHIPNGIINIKNNAFSNGSVSKIPYNITTLDFGAAVIETIGNFAFQNAPFSSNLEPPSTLKTIGQNAFSSSKISKIDLHECELLTTLQPAAFADCDQVSSIIFNDNLKIIANPLQSGLGVFQGLKKFTGTLHLPSKLEIIGHGAFNDLGFDSAVDVILEWDQCTELKQIGSNAFTFITFKANTQLIIPDKVTKLGNQVFDGSKGLTHIEIPASMTEIGANALTMSLTPSADIFSIVKIKKTTTIYSYLVPDPTKNWGNQPFEYWLRGTNIEPSYSNINPQVGAQLLVPQSLLTLYQNAFPTTMRPAIIGY